jgi:hypothetical protein
MLAAVSDEKVLIMKSFPMGRVFRVSTIAASLRGLFLVGVLSTVSAPAFAVDEQAAVQACTPDVMRLCQQFIPDHDRVGACLAHNKKQLSAGCRSVMSTPKSVKKQRHASN